MIKLEELRHGKTFYMYRKDGFLMRCELFKVGNTWQYLTEENNWDLTPLYMKDLKDMYNTREEAEQLELLL